MRLDPGSSKGGGGKRLVGVNVGAKEGEEERVGEGEEKVGEERSSSEGEGGTSPSCVPGRREQLLKIY